MKNGLKGVLRAAIVVYPLAACAVADLPGNITYVNASEAIDQREYDKAYRLLTGLIERGGFHDEASVKVQLADLYLKGRGTEKDVGRAVQLLKDAGASRDDLTWAAIAQYKLGSIYELGEPPVSADRVEAVRWYQKAARLGDDIAVSAVERLYEYPEVYVQANPEEFQRLRGPAPGALADVPDIAGSSPERAFNIVRWHAHAGNARAQLELARMYLQGIGTPKDAAAAPRWVYRAAEAGDAEAQYTLAVEYYRGDLVPIDDGKVREWLEVAAENRHPAAINDLGALYVNPLARGQRPDYEKARSYFEEAATLGNAKAMTNLGDLYAGGLGVGQDLERARDFYRQAAALGSQVAEERLAQADSEKPAQVIKETIVREVVVQRENEDGSVAERVFNANLKSVFQVLVGAVSKRDGKFQLTKGGAGSAVAVSAHHALTNCHVVKGMDLVALKVEGELKFAKVVHRDTMADVCILESSEVQLQPVKSTRAYEDLRVGETVFAIGSPAGFENSLSHGIVSGKRRMDGNTWIQTTAAISPGSSGGGLFDRDGNLIGITSFKTAGEGDEGLNFAAPATRHFDLARGL